MLGLNSKDVSKKGSWWHKAISKSAIDFTEFTECIYEYIYIYIYCLHNKGIAPYIQILLFAWLPKCFIFWISFI